MASATKSRRSKQKRSLMPPPRGRSVPLTIPALEPVLFQSLAVEAGLQIVVSPLQLANLAANATEALRDAAHVAVTKLPSVAAQRRDWCGMIARQAHNLADGLGARGGNPDGGWAPLQAHANLEPGIAKLLGSFELQDLLVIAVPSLPKPAVEDAILNLLGRLAPGLYALATIAEAARDDWAGQVRRGSSDPDEARRLLVDRLAGVFETMFGRPATVSVRYTAEEKREHRPGGPAIVWFTGFFRNLLDVIESRSEDDVAAAALATIARSAVNSQRADTVAHWLRNARRSQKRAID